MPEHFRSKFIAWRRWVRRSAWLAPIVALFFSVFPASKAWADGEARPFAVEPLLATLKRTAPGDGSQSAAAAAWRQLAQADASELPTILAALDDAGPLATNWIRTAAEAIVERTHSASALARAELQRFLLDRRHAPSGRRFAYEMLLAGDPALADRVLPTMLDDPSLELRRDAVARVLDTADRLGEKDAAKAQYEIALDAARDIDQIRRAADKLDHFGRAIDLARHFGFVTRWKVIGPFDNRGRIGNATIYPPEQTRTARAPDFTATYPGKDGPVAWRDFATQDQFGQVDINKALGRKLEVVAYAAADFNAAATAKVELRVGTENACRVWLNGQMLLESPAYHSLPVMDQFIGRGKLHAGHNTILVKLCQNEQAEEWARAWQFQLRVCDATGKAIQPASASNGSERQGARSAGSQNLRSAP
jgi:hypothetical protein